MIAFVSQVAESVGPEGRYLHRGLTSSDVLDTALALQLGAAGDLLLRDADRLVGALVVRATIRSRDADDGPHPLGPRRADDVRAEACRLGLRGRSRPATPRRGRRRDPDRQDLRTGRDVQPPRPGPRGRGPWRSSACGRTRSPPRSSSATATPRSWPRSRSSAGAWSASRPRSATSLTRRSARSWSRSGPARRAAPRCPTSGTRSSRSESRGSPASSVAMPRPRSRTRRSGTSGTSATRRRSG